MNAPRRLTLDDRVDWPGGWLRDSQSVLFYSDRNGDLSIFKQGINDGRAEAISVGPEEERAPQLSPDGRWILYLVWAKAEKGIFPTVGSMMRVPISGGIPQWVLNVKGYPGSAQVPRSLFLFTARGYPAFRCPSLPTASCVLSEADEKQIIFSAFDPVEGRKRELVRVDIDASTHTSWDLSPDGARIALVKSDDRIRILSLSDGTAREVPVKGWWELDSVGWSADGKSLFVTNYYYKGSTLLRVALNGETQMLRQGILMLERPIASPDGQYLAFGEVSSNRNVWMIENF